MPEPVNPYAPPTEDCSLVSEAGIDLGPEELQSLPNPIAAMLERLRNSSTL